MFTISIRTKLDLALRITEKLELEIPILLSESKFFEPSKNRPRIHDTLFPISISRNFWTSTPFMIDTNVTRIIDYIKRGFLYGDTPKALENKKYTSIHINSLHTSKVYIRIKNT